MLGVEPPTTQVDLKWRMLGIPVRVHPLFWILSLILFWDWRELGFTILLVAIAAETLSIIVHEYGHALTGRYFGAQEPRIVLYAMGGLTIHRTQLPRGQRIAELFMGPGAGFIVAGVLYGVSFAVDIDALFFAGGWQRHVWAFYEVTLWVSLVWGAVNLLPVYPLDGGQIAREVIERFRPGAGTRLAFLVSMVAAILVAVAFLVLYFRGDRSPFALFPVFLFGYLALLNYQLARAQAMGGARGDWGGGEEPRQPWEQDPDWWKG